MSISQRFPTGEPSLFINFTSPERLDPRVRVVRNSVGSYVDTDGTIQYADVNAPRFDHDPSTQEPLGLLIEGVQTNNYLRSGISSITGFSLTNVSFTNNSITSPDGSLNATLVTEDASVGTHSFNPSTITGISAGNRYCFSVFYKQGPGNIDFTMKSIQTSVNRAVCFVNTTNNTISVSSGISTDQGIIAHNNGWYRAWFSFTAEASTNFPEIFLRDGSTYVGDGTSGVYFWGAQIERNGFPSSYIPTPSGGGTATRSAEGFSIDNVNTFLNRNEGSFYVNYKPRFATVDQLSGVSAQILCADQSTVKRIIDINVNVGAATSFSTTTSSTLGSTQIWTTDFNKIVSTYGPRTSNDTNFLRSIGGKVGYATDTTFTSTNLPTNSIHSNSAIPSGNAAQGWYKILAYYPYALSQSAIQQITI